MQHQQARVKLISEFLSGILVVKVGAACRPPGVFAFLVCSFDVLWYGACPQLFSWESSAFRQVQSERNKELKHVKGFSYNIAGLMTVIWSTCLSCLCRCCVFSCPNLQAPRF